MEVAKQGRPKLAGTVVLLGVASLLNDISSDMIAAVLPVFLITLPGGTPLFLGLVEGAADSVASRVLALKGSRGEGSRICSRISLVAPAPAAGARDAAVRVHAEAGRRHRQPPVQQQQRPVTGCL